MKKYNKIHFMTGVFSILVMISLIIIFSVFRNRIESKIQKTAEKNLSSVSSAISAIFYTKLDDQLVMLESQARYFQSIDLSDYNAMKDTIMSTKGIGGFNTIGVANSSGATINYNGTSSGNIYLEDYYRKAMKGSNTISKSTVIDEKGNEVLVLAVPIRKINGINGIVYGTFTKNVLDSIMDSVSSSQDSAHLLISPDKKVLAKTSSSQISSTASVIEDVIPDAELPDGDTKIQYYSINDKNYIAILVPVGVHNWYFVNIVPETVITDQTSQIIFDVVIAVINVMLVFGTVMFYITSLLRKNEHITNVNERFRLAVTQSHNIIFSYDYKRAEMTVEGNASLIIPNAKDVYNSSDINGFESLIHPEDTNVMQLIRSASDNSQSAILSEFRLKCTDSHYYWFRMNASVIRDETGKPVQLIGNVFNIDEQMNKEIQLIERAETDSLTGLLNKGAFHTKLCNTIEERHGSDIIALFIVDLDNFKAVNDNLGHAMGDKVLSDVARKLNSVFVNKSTVGRIGGDEFSAFMIMENTDSEKALQLIIQKAALLCERMKETYSAYKTEVKVSASVGIAVCPKDGINYDTLYKNADKALYCVKNNGKGIYSIYSKEVHEK